MVRSGAQSGALAAVLTGGILLEGTFFLETISLGGAAEEEGQIANHK
jgi:hypothetical protein